MSTFCINTAIYNIVLGVVSNVIFSLIVIYVIQRIRYWCCLKRRFNNRFFEVYWKQKHDDLVFKIKCKVDGNRILYNGKNVMNNSEISGEFIISPINLRFGEGFNYHIDGEGFGFTKIIIKDKNTFFVESPFTTPEPNSKPVKGIRRYQAFVWKKTI